MILKTSRPNFVIEKTKTILRLKGGVNFPILVHFNCKYQVSSSGHILRAVVA
ncbi:hypothetical protein I79_003558 [Cricetulus griseus]|uniref:Uncharacterized protein n=1 Tax=Cricetulus griseus TaxID=10029 RepID=G3H0A4_CRIGR|nr:hypothetical protein I79_003558 [Cricetulus griseus]